MAGSTMIVSDTTFKGNPILATVSPLGELRVENPASQLFNDTFDTGSLDTVNKWSSVVGSGGAITTSVGSSLQAPGTTANGFTKLTSQLTSKDINGNIRGTFKPTEPGFLLFNARINLSGFNTTGTLFHMGLGTSPGTPTIASPITQFIGFELNHTSGKMFAIVYQTGTRVVIQDLSAATGNGTQPLDANAHKYFVYFRGDIAYWCIDDKDNIVANFQTGASGPDINTLPVLFQGISNAGTAQTMQVNAISVGDTSHTGGTQLLSNAATLEPQACNQDSISSLVTISAQGTGTVNSSDFVNTNGRGVVLGINTTAITAGSYTVALQAKDISSGQYYTIATTAATAITGAIAATGLQFFTLYPGVVGQAATATVGPIVNHPLPRTWRVQVVVTTGPVTATIGASVLN